MKIGMILDGEFPPDDRPEKEAMSLIAEGHAIYLLSVTSMKKRPLKETYKGIRITRFRLPIFIQKKLSALYLLLPFYRWIFTYHSNKFVIENGIEVLHIHDLPLSNIAHLMAKRHAIKVVLDQHELYSRWIIHTAHYNTFAGKIVRKLSNWEKYESHHLKGADLIITVSENLKQTYTQLYNLEASSIISIPNTPLRTLFNDKNIDENIVRKNESSFTLFYAGVIDILRGIDLPIKALPLLVERIPNIKIILAGRLAMGCNPIALAKSLNVDHFVEFVGWIPINQLPSYIAGAKICFFTPPIVASEEIHNTIVNKIYQYTAMKRPILVSEARMMKEFIEHNNLGYSVSGNDVRGFSERVIDMYTNYDQIEKNSIQGAEQLINSGNIFWENTVQELVDYYAKN